MADTYRFFKHTILANFLSNRFMLVFLPVTYEYTIFIRVLSFKTAMLLHC